MDAPGTLVMIHNTPMHVFRIPASSAQNKGTLVFLSGSGTECPLYDFKPLWDLLADKYHMAVVDRPGYGWSAQTNQPRDIDTVLEETRGALKLAGISGPFIPVPHSLSGLEALYWAQKYPDEVKAVIGLDMAVPEIYDSMGLPKHLSLLIPLCRLLRRPFAWMTVRSHPAVKNGLLNREEQDAMRRVVSRQMLSQNMIDEIGFVKDNAHKVAAGSCPIIPVLCFLSTDKNQLKRIPLWGKAHRGYFAGNKKARFIELPCGHYVHREEPDTIAQAMGQFFQDEPVFN